MTGLQELQPYEQMNMKLSQIRCRILTDLKIFGQRYFGARDIDIATNDSIFPIGKKA
jgi:hypothetical protein